MPELRGVPELRSCGITVATLALTWLLPLATAMAQTPVPATTPKPAGENPPAESPTAANPAGAAQEPKGFDAATQQRVDEFVAAMPRSPGDLRDPTVRQQIAGKALPALRRAREHTLLHPNCGLAPRIHEFTVYAVVLGDRDLRTTLQELATAGDQGAAVLLQAADVILAGDDDSRRTAIGAVAKGLRAEPSEAVAAARRGDEAKECAAHCLATAAVLTEAEAKLLAEHAGSQRFGGQFLQVAEAAASDPVHRLGKPFPLQGKLLDGSAFDLASLRGKVIVIDFWATWCGPCVRAMPELVRVKQELGDKIAVVGVSCDEDEAAMRKFLAAHPEVDWPQLFAGEWHPVAKANGVTAIPRLFVVDRDGVLRHVDAGTDLAATVRRYVADAPR